MSSKKSGSNRVTLRDQRGRLRKTEEKDVLAEDCDPEGTEQAGRSGL